MKLSRLGQLLLLSLTVVALVVSAGAATTSKGTIGINVVLNTDITDSILADLGTHGMIHDVVYEIRAVTLGAPASELAVIQALPYVAAANPDAERDGRPVDTVLVTDFHGGNNTWDLDAINVTDFGVTPPRQVAFDGSGVYVAVLDTGLVDLWRRYFPQERIAANLAKSFSGGGALGAGNVSEQPNKWEHDTNSHGTHVTSTILGYSFFGIAQFNGVAPLATVIPVKVLNQNGSGWSSMVARGIVYVADLKAGPLAGSPVVINMSLSGPVLDAMEKAAIDFAISKGVILVASAGNRGTRGMGFPAAYAPVISAAASGWIGEWIGGSSWWRTKNVPDPSNAADNYIAAFSSRQLSGQDLDVAAPGTWVVGPFQTSSGQISYFFLGGPRWPAPTWPASSPSWRRRNRA